LQNPYLAFYHTTSTYNVHIPSTNEMREWYTGVSRQSGGQLDSPSVGETLCLKFLSFHLKSSKWTLLTHDPNDGQKGSWIMPPLSYYISLFPMTKLRWGIYPLQSVLALVW